MIEKSGSHIFRAISLFFGCIKTHTHKLGDMNKIRFFFLECISHDGAIEINTKSSICGAHSATSIERYSPL